MLGLAIADLFADHFEFRRVQSCRLVIGNGDDLDRHLRLVKEQGCVIVAIDETPVLVLGCALVLDDLRAGGYAIRIPSKCSAPCL